MRSSARSVNLKLSSRAANFNPKSKIELHADVLSLSGSVPVLDRLRGGIDRRKHGRAFGRADGSGISAFDERSRTSRGIVNEIRRENKSGFVPSRACAASMFARAGLTSISTFALGF